MRKRTKLLETPIDILHVIKNIIDLTFLELSIDIKE